MGQSGALNFRLLDIYARWPIIAPNRAINQLRKLHRPLMIDLFDKRVISTIGV